MKIIETHTDIKPPITIEFTSKEALAIAIILGNISSRKFMDLLGNDFKEENISEDDITKLCFDFYNKVYEEYYESK